MCKVFAKTIEGYTQKDIKEVADLSAAVTKTVTLSMDKPSAKTK